MSFNRLIYYSVVIGGWSAFLGWLVSEWLVHDSATLSNLMAVALTAALVGAAIGAGLNLVAGMVNAGWAQQSRRLVVGLVTGGIGGAVGGFLGQFLFQSFGLSRVIGWILMGSAIGMVEGLYERSSARLRNGLIGGALGGFLGGLLLEPIMKAINSGTGMSGRATSFVILGACIGLLIGFIKVVLKDAWLTVLDGYRPGRQLILAGGEATLGRAEYATLPFSGRSDEALGMIHAKVVREPGGGYAVEDNQTTLGTLVNRVRIYGRTPLKDNDLITIGSNSIKFRESARREGAGVGPAGGSSATLPPLPTGAGSGAKLPPIPGGQAFPTLPETRPAPTPRQTAPKPQPEHRPEPSRPQPQAQPQPQTTAFPELPPRQPLPQAPARPQPQPQTQARPQPQPQPQPQAARPQQPVPQPAAQPASQPGICPKCHRKVVPGQQYCIVHQDE